MNKINLIFLILISFFPIWLYNCSFVDTGSIPEFQNNTPEKTISFFGQCLSLIDKRNDFRKIRVIMTGKALEDVNNLIKRLYADESKITEKEKKTNSLIKKYSKNILIIIVKTQTEKDTCYATTQYFNKLNYKKSEVKMTLKLIDNIWRISEFSSAIPVKD